jgi:hypothetical protein
MHLDSPSVFNLQKGGKGKTGKFLQRERFPQYEATASILNPEETVVFLGLAAQDVPILVANKLLTPLGNPV